MRLERFVFAVGLLMLLSGCMSMAEPMVAYKDSKHPRSDTSVFAVDRHMVNEDGTATGAVLSVDGHSTRDYFSMTEQVPPWVRVLPGDHTFEITYLKSNRQSMVKTVSVPNMSPRHVYVAHLVDQGMTYKIDVQDIGDTSSFKEHVPNFHTMESEDVTVTF
jgi:hypothetical protein